MKKVIFAVGVLLLIVLSGCSSDSGSEGGLQGSGSGHVDNGSLKDSIDSDVGTVVEKSPVELCREWAGSIVPETIEVHEGASSCKRKLYGSWNDGEPVMIVGKKVEYWDGENRVFQVLKGSAQGEDTSKYYVKDLSGTLVSLKYSKQIVENGVVKGSNSFEISVDSFDRVAGSEEELEQIGCLKYEYSLGDYEFISCEKTS